MRNSIVAIFVAVAPLQGCVMTVDLTGGAATMTAAERQAERDARKKRREDLYNAWKPLIERFLGSEDSNPLRGYPRRVLRGKSAF